MFNLLKRSSFIIFAMITVLFVTGCGSNEASLEKEETKQVDMVVDQDTNSSDKEEVIEKNSDKDDGKVDEDSKESDAKESNDKNKKSSTNKNNASTKDNTTKDKEKKSNKTKSSSKNEKKQTAPVKKDNKKEKSSKKDTKNTSKKQSQKKKSSSSESKSSVKTPEKPTKKTETKQNSPEETVTVTITTGNVKGTILSSSKVAFKKGDTALSVTQRILKEKGIQSSVRGSGSSAYVEGIDNLYEFDEGPLSGWLFKVDGSSPGIGAGAYELKPNQKIEWVYTVDYTK